MEDRSWLGSIGDRFYEPAPSINCSRHRFAFNVEPPSIVESVLQEMKEAPPE